MKYAVPCVVQSGPYLTKAACETEATVKLIIFAENQNAIFALNFLHCLLLYVIRLPSNKSCEVLLLSYFQLC